MTGILSQAQLESLEILLHGDAGDAFLDMMQSLSLHQDHGSCDPEALQYARHAELVQVDEQGGCPVLTPLGWKVSDSVREYVFWRERDRQMPLYNERPAFEDAVFRDRRVLEIGSGCGCNLFSLQPIASAVAGMEIEPVYLQMASVLAKRAGIEPPLVHLGPAEQLPFDDSSQDVVLAFGSLQYMELKPVLDEVHRVLDVDGVFIATLSPLSLYMRYEIREPMASRDVKRLLRAFVVLGNTYHQQWFARRPGWFEDRSPLNRRVFPTRSHMRRLLLEAGLTPDDALTEDEGHERIYVARKLR
jgi:ubiquinone/menaquinone biosynthesis C-methylase UbiE